MSDSAKTEETSQTYEAGCHCGHVKLSVTLTPSLQTYKVLNCNCSICRRLGYLLVYPTYDEVTWHDGSKEKCSKYEVRPFAPPESRGEKNRELAFNSLQFNTKTRDHLFCPKCGASIGIDFQRLGKLKYGINVRTFDGIDLDKIQLEKFDGLKELTPHEDSSSGR
ncbi:hypothetical protein NLU13_5200 [Sarocladium strictum]|uniref:CENP-V/GFA domain-containing protein n=1 Tax=Sarocladium strictum TaxID=5046 RepID=A0AA39GGF1_SARSR|nr:hypothetical protein NLU13_5200 [Sarocladium strictum]